MRQGSGGNGWNGLIQDAGTGVATPQAPSQRVERVSGVKVFSLHWDHFLTSCCTHCTH